MDQLAEPTRPRPGGAGQQVHVPGRQCPCHDPNSYDVPGLIFIQSLHLQLLLQLSLIIYIAMYCCDYRQLIKSIEYSVLIGCKLSTVLPL